MPLTLTDPSSVALDAEFLSGDLRISHDGTLLPITDQSIVCEVDSTAQVDFSLEFSHSDPNRTIAATHLDAAGQTQSWSGSNPCEHTFGLTGGFIDVTATASANSETKVTVIKIKVKPKIEKPFGA